MGLLLDTLAAWEQSRARKENAVALSKWRGKPQRILVIEDFAVQIRQAEKRCAWYRELLAEGQSWCSVPLELTQRWLTLLQRDAVTGPEAAELVRLCDEWEKADFDPGFHEMRETIRCWYRAIYYAELSQTFRKPDQ